MKTQKISILLAMLFAVTNISAQSTLERYQKAEEFLPKNISKLTRNVNLRINPVEGTRDFWYKLQTEEGEKYYYFNGEDINSEEAFDHIKLAASLSGFTEKEVNPDSLLFP